jgi:hypothetical protein
MFSTLTRRMPCTEKFLRWILPRGLLTILVLVVCVFIIGNTRRIETGIVEYKLITGENDGVLHVLLVNMNRKNIVVVEKMNDIAHGEYSETSIDRALEDEMNRYFTDVQYNVVVRLSRSNTLENFSVTREIFNDARTNSLIRFEIANPYSNRIIRIVPEDSDMIAVDADYPPANEIRQVMYQ